MKTSRMIRKACAWMLAIGMTLTPVLPATIAEEQGTPVPTVEVTATATPVSTPTPEPTATPAASAETTPEPSAVPTAEPDAEPTSEPSVDPTAEPSVEPSAEPSVEPIMSLTGIALYGATGTISSDDEELTLFGGNSGIWSIDKITGYTGAFYNLTVTPLDGAPASGVLTATTASSGISIKTYAVTQKREYKISVTGEDTSNALVCTVTVLPRPTSISFKGLSSTASMNLAVAKGYNFKYIDGDQTKPRYDFTFASGVNVDDIDITKYEKLITFTSSNSNVLTIGKEDGQTIKAAVGTAIITMTIKDDSSGTAMTPATVTVTVTADPDSITITNTNPLKMIPGTKETLTYQLKAGSTVLPSLMADAVKIESSDDTVVEVKGTTLIANSAGTATITASIDVNGTTKKDTLAVAVQGVPKAGELVLKTSSGLTIPTDDSGNLVLGKAETLFVYPTHADDADDKTYIGTIGSASDNNTYVKATTATSGTQKGVNLVAQSTANATPTNVTITVNGDLQDANGDSLGVTLTVPVVIVEKPTAIALNKTTASVCVEDSFILTVTPTPAGSMSRYTVTPSASDIVTIQELEPTGDAPSVARFQITGAKAGTVTLTVKSTANSSLSKTCTVTVAAKPTTFTFDNAVSVSAGSVYQIKPYFGTADNPIYSKFIFSYISGDISVDGDTGVVSAKGSGVAKVMIESDVYPGLSAQVCTINVTSAPQTVSVGTDNTVYLSVGETVTIKPSLNPQAFTNMTYTLDTVDPDTNVNTVEAVQVTPSEDGQSVTLKGLKLGANQLTVKTVNKAGIPSSSYSAKSCTVKVYVCTKPTGISAKNQTMFVGETLKPAYTLTPTGSNTSGVYYKIEQLSGTEGYWGTDANGYASWISYSYSAGKAVTDDQITPGSVTSTSGQYTGTYITAKDAGWIKVTVRPQFVAAGGTPSATFYIEIIEAPATIAFSDTSDMKLLTGMTQTRAAVLKTASGATVAGTISYGSSDNVVATVDANGKVTAGVTGTAVISATNDFLGKTVTYTVKVSNAPSQIILPDLSVDSPLEIGVGESQTFGTDIDITYDPPLTSADYLGLTPTLQYINQITSTLTLSGSKVTGKVAGDGKVTVAAQNGTKVDAVFKVLAKPSKVAFDVTKANVGDGETYTIVPKVYKTATALAGSETRKALTWTSSNPALATVTVNADGSASVKIADDVYDSTTTKTVTIKATSVCSTSVYAQCVLTILNKPKEIAVDQTAPTAKADIHNTPVEMAIGTSITVKPYTLPVGAGGQILPVYSTDITTDVNNTTALLYLVENTSAGTYTIKSLNEGTAIITFKTYTTSTRLTIKVQPAPTVDEVTLPAGMLLAVGMEQLIEPTVDSGKSADFRFYSADKTSLTVNETTGLAQAKIAGKAVTVTVKWLGSGGTTLQKDMTVKTVSAPTAIRLAKLNPADDFKTIIQDGLSSLSLSLCAGDEYTFEYYYLPNADINLTPANHAISDTSIVLPTSLTVNDPAFSILSHEENAGRDGGRVTLKANRTASAISFTLKTTNGKTATVSVTVKATPTDVYALIGASQTAYIGAGLSATMTATPHLPTAGGEIYFEAEPGYADVLTVDPKTGKITVLPDNKSAETVKIYARSSSLPSDFQSANNVCTVYALRAPDEDDIADYMVRKGTDIKLNIGSDDENVLCVGESLTASCVFPTLAQCATVGDYQIYSGTSVTYAVDPADKAYISVTSAGVIKGLKATPDGTLAKVYATAKNGSYTGVTVTIPFRVTAAPTALTVAFSTDYSYVLTTGLKMTVSDVIDLEKSDGGGMGMKLAVTPAPLSVDELFITATSSNASIVSITKDENENSGHFTLKALKAGTVTITFSTFNGKKASFKVTSSALPDSLKLSCGDKITLGAGMEQVFTVSCVPTSASIPSAATLSVESEDADVTVNLVDGTTDKYIIRVANNISSTKGVNVIAKMTYINQLGDKTTKGGSTYVTALPGPTDITVDQVTGGNPTQWADDNYNLGVGETRTVFYTVESSVGFAADKYKTTISFSGASDDKGSIKWGTPSLVQTISTNKYQYKVVITAVRAGTVDFSINASNGETASAGTFTIAPAATKVVVGVPTTSLTIAPGEMYTFNYGTSPEKSKDSLQFTWSDPKGILETYEASNGKITVSIVHDAIAKSVATVTIKTYNGKSATVKFTVGSPAAASDKLTLKSSLSLAEGDIKQLTYTLPAGKSGASVRFKQTDSGDGDLGLDEVAGTICPEPSEAKDSNGKYCVWKATVKAYFTDADGAEHESNEITITVTPGPQETPLTTTVGGMTEVTLGKGETLTMTYVKYAASYAAFSTAYTYLSDDPDIATYSGGKITAKGTKPLADGTFDKATVTLLAKNGNMKELEVTVKDAPTSIVWDDDKSTSKSVTMYVSGTAYALGQGTLTFTLLPATAHSNTITYSSSNSKVVTVDASGNLVAKAKGTAKITVKTFNGKTCTLTITVPQ